MDNQLTTNFVKQALSVGIPREKIASILNKAQEISTRGNPKQAAYQFDTLVTNLLTGANLNKTASSVAYTTGILKEAVDLGYTDQDAITITKQALAKTGQNLTIMSKLAEIAKIPELANYAEGFLKSAMSAGMSQEDASVALINLVEQEKRAVDPSAGAEMFKQPTAPAGDPGLGAGPMGAGAGGGDPSPGQGGLTLPNGQPIPPEILAQILAMISGGLGGPQMGGQAGTPPAVPPQGGPSPAAGLAQ